MRSGRARAERGDGVVAAAVPRHGVGRLPVDPADHGCPTRPGRTAGLPGQARQLDAVDQRLEGHRHRWPELRLGPGHSRTRSDAGARPEPADPGAQRCRASRPERRRGVRARRRAVRLHRGRSVPRVRHGRGSHRWGLPAAAPRAAHRQRRSRRARTRPSCQAARHRRRRRGARRASSPVARSRRARPGDEDRPPRHVRAAAGTTRR